MTQLPDVFCWIKVVDDATGKELLDGMSEPDRKLTVRYSVANDSHKAAGPLSVVGSLRRNGVKITIPGSANVVPLQNITVQPGQVWTKEFPVSESGNATYAAALIADVGNMSANEENETNNVAKSTFLVQAVPR